MADHEISEEGKRSRFARWEAIGIERIKDDLLTGGHQPVGGPPAVRELAWQWVRMKEAKPIEVVQLKPAFYGVSIDLKEVGRRLRSFVNRRLDRKRLER
jgi:hypothetical protein